MIKVSVLYPNQDDGRFDISYYCNKHIPLVRNLLSPTLKGVAVDRGIAGQAPGSPAPYLAMGHLLFESVEEFQGTFGLHAQTIMSDIPNYTNTQPIVQISEVKL